MKQELLIEKQRCHFLEQKLSCKAIGERENDPPSPEREPSKRGGASFLGSSSYDSHGVGLAEQLATLEMKELNERQRAELAVMRHKQVCMYNVPACIYMQHSHYQFISTDKLCFLGEFQLI